MLYAPINRKGFFMARMAWVEAVGYPHHVIERGNRRQAVFFRKGDEGVYLRILKLQAQKNFIVELKHKFGKILQTLKLGSRKR